MPADWLAGGMWPSRRTSVIQPRSTGPDHVPPLQLRWEGGGGIVPRKIRVSKPINEEVADTVQAKTTFHSIEKNNFKYNFDAFIHSLKCWTHDNVFSGRESRCPWNFRLT